MTYVIDAEDADLVEHAGVKGMKWGVRKERSSGGSRRSSSASKPAAKLTPEQRKALGKKIVGAVVATAGGIGVAALAGPIAGAAVSAAVKGVIDVSSTTTTSESSTVIETYSSRANS
jgi:hypothetical protein